MAGAGCCHPWRNPQRLCEAATRTSRPALAKDGEQRWELSGSAGRPFDKAWL